MAHFSLLDLSHAAFDDIKAYRAVTTTLILPCSTIRPCSSTTTLSARIIVEPVSDRNHGSTIRKLI